jgi:hypothetical protein
MWGINTKVIEIRRPIFTIAGTRAPKKGAIETMGATRINPKMNRESTE